MSSSPSSLSASGPVRRLFKKIVNIQPQEVRAVFLSFGYFFFLLSSYYILRPLRDEMGVAGGTKNLPWLFTATFIALLAAAPLLAALVAKLPRAKFIPIVYQFFAVNIVLFWVLLRLDVSTLLIARVFFVWVTIFSVFTVSVFWSFMADLYTPLQSKRLFGFIAAGGSIGTLLGPLMTRQLAEPLGPTNLLLIAAVLLEIAVFCAWKLERTAPSLHAETSSGAIKLTQEKKALAGGSFDGFALLLRSPYLSGIALWVFLLSLAGTFLYLQQANLVAAASDDPATRTKIFATIDLAVGIVTILVQFLATGRLISRFGTGAAAAFLPLVFALGFVALAIHPVLMVVVIFQAVQRAANFGIANPARESLFTVLSREEKFKTKNIIDGAVFRGADALNAWFFVALAGAMTLPILSLATVPIAAGWLLLSLGLGRAQERRAALDNEMRRYP
jgi:ATP:ADP antiporter, AAA family